MRQISISLSLLLLAVCVCFPWHRAVFTRPEISLKNMKMREREGKEGGRADCYAALVSFGGANRRGRLPHLAIMQRTRGLKSDKMHRLSHDSTEFHAFENVGHGN